jgi:uncharacterized protein
MKLENALFAAILIIIISGTASASSMRLLAVSEKDGGYQGSVADIYLTITPGSGRVFIDTFPLMKVDTQISTRFAKEMACEEANAYCEDLDFFYTIRSSSALVGGPSASAAIAAMTYADLKNYKIEDSVAATGTINSGGIIGAVGGIKEKIEAAAKAGIKTVLIPEGEDKEFSLNESCLGKSSNLTCERNMTITGYANELGVNIIEVSTLSEIIFYTTGKQEKVFSGNISRDAEYERIMSEVAESLCNQSYKLISNLEKKSISYLNDTVLSQYEYAKNLSRKSKTEIEKGNYYSAASYCFGSNLKLRFVQKLIENMSSGEIISYYNDVSRFIKESADGLSRNYSTISGFQAYIIVASRLSEADEYLHDAMAAISDKRKEDAVYAIAYAEERTKSANLWKKFLLMPGKKIDFSDEKLKEICLSKASEAEERYQYASIFLSTKLDNVNQRIIKALKEAENGEYEKCFSDSAIAKAESDTILGLSEISEKDLPALIDKRLEATKQVILKEGEKGRFPISGFSYYEYAGSLKEEQPASALLYSGYALELSNMEIYFRQKRLVSWNKITPLLGIIAVFLSGAAAGAVLTIISKKRRMRFIHRKRRY